MVCGVLLRGLQVVAIFAKLPAHDLLVEFHDASEVQGMESMDAMGIGADSGC